MSSDMWVLEIYRSASDPGSIIETHEFNSLASRRIASSKTAE